MRNVLRKVCAVTVALGVCVAQAGAEVVKVPAGTAIILKSTSDVSTAATVGDMVTLVVASDVVVGGKVVAKAGATATGEVVAVVKRKFFGIPAKLSVTVQRVTLSDGTFAMVNKTKTVDGEDQMVCSIIGTILCLLPALIRGGDAKIPSGSVFDAMTIAPAEVTL